MNQFRKIQPHRYWMCGFAIQSNIELPELLTNNVGRPDYRVVIHSARSLHQVSQWVDTQRDLDGHIWYQCARSDSAYLVRMLDMVDFVVTKDEQEIHCYPNLAVPAETIRHLLLDHMLPRLLSRRLHISLHGSAVATPAGAIAFLGSSGRGKSTLATSFWHAGYRLLTDDCLAITTAKERFFCVPSYPGVRAWADTTQRYQATGRTRVVAHYTAKHRIELAANSTVFSTTPVPLHQLYILSEPSEADDGTITIKPMSPQEGLIELVRHTYRLDASDQIQLTREFANLSDLVTQCAIFRLTHPRNYDLLPAVQAAILSNRSAGQMLGTTTTLL